jgi:hypothetical protein
MAGSTTTQPTLPILALKRNTWSAAVSACAQAVHVDNFHSQMLSANSEVLSKSDAHLFSAEL